MIHNVDVHRTEHLPLVVINIAMDDVKLSKEESVGYMCIQSLEISELRQRPQLNPHFLYVRMMKKRYLTGMKEIL